MSSVYIGIGSNLGDREANCRTAITLMNEHGIIVRQESSMVATEPWGMTEQPEFINMAVMAETGLSPDGLLDVLKGIEADMGRVHTGRWGPRIIDLDILFYDDMIISTATLIVPHPLLAQREFVLKPLAEISPDYIHPQMKRSVRELLDELGHSR